MSFCYPSDWAHSVEHETGVHPGLLGEIRRGQVGQLAKRVGASGCPDALTEAIVQQSAEDPRSPREGEQRLGVQMRADDREDVERSALEQLELLGLQADYWVSYSGTESASGAHLRFARASLRFRSRSLLLGLGSCEVSRKGESAQVLRYAAVSRSAICAAARETETDAPLTFELVVTQRFAVVGRVRLLLASSLRSHLGVVGSSKN